MANSRLYVVDADGRDMPDGCPGEIWAAGVGLARGYWGDAKRTAARFVDDPCRGRLFRTGDIGRYLPDGEVDILGRIDQQIKVNGYRIEAGEVEVRLLAIPGIGQAAVVAAPGAGGARLVAHLAAGGPASSGGRPEEADIRRQLAVDLPAYMIPSAIAWHDELPLTRNGKVDRSALAALAGASPTTVDGLAPQAGTVEVIAGIWAEALRVKAVAPRARFGDLGGDSIAAARIVTAVRKRYGVTIPLHRLAEVDTVEEMARYVEDGAGR